MSVTSQSICSKKAIITGATGGLGRNLCAYLLAHGWRVLACGRNSQVGKMLGTTFQAFDLSQPYALQKAVISTDFCDADVVFHCAALSSPWGSVQSFYHANVAATEQVMQAMSLLGIPKLVHVSTSSVYFDFTDRLDVCEDFLPAQFANAYAVTKYQAEQTVIQYVHKKPEIQAIILRPRGIFGEYDTALLPRLKRVADKGFLPLVCRGGRQGKLGGQAVVDVTYVGNVVYAMHLAAEALIDDGSVPLINITNDEPMTITNIYTQVVEHLGLKVRFKTIPYRFLATVAAGMECAAKAGFTQEPMLTRYGLGMIAFDQTLNLENARKYLNYQPVYRVEEGLQRYVKYVKIQ